MMESKEKRPRMNGGQMENPWRVATNYVCGKKDYQVYRFRHLGETDHTGNREQRGGIFRTKKEAQVLADELNDAERR